MLLLSDRVDEWVVSNLTEFEGKPLQSVAKGDLDLGKLADEAEKKEQEQEAGEYKELLGRMKKALGEKRQGGAHDHRLTDSPACLVADQYGMSMNLERLLKAAGQKVPAAKPILEINPHHPLVQTLKHDGRARFSDWCTSCSIRRCSPKAVSSRIPATFVKRLNELMLALTKQ